MKKLISFMLISSVLIFIFLLIINPEICIKNTALGIILCGKVIIPSLFPFTFCVLFILKSGALENLKFLEKITKPVFGLNSQMFIIFLLSLIGGYPLGAKILNESQIDKKTSSLMLNYCVNAGPAFIIGAVGNGIFSSQTIGVLLFVSHITPSFILAFIFRKKIKNTAVKKRGNKINIMDNFVISATESAKTLINICSFIILFSSITGYINFYSREMPVLNALSFILEVTNAINQSKNVIIISALLGFGGLCVWCQVSSICKNFKINYLQLVFCKIFHAVMSASLSFIMIKIFKITIPAISNNMMFSFSAFYNGYTVGISLIITCIVLIISILPKNFTGNIIGDIV